MQKTFESPQPPIIRRARGYRLYDQRGRRFLDLSLAGGRTLLGHRPGRLVSKLKGVLEKGLLSPMPSVYDARLKKELSRRYPDFTGAVIVSSPAETTETIARYLQCKAPDIAIADPAMGETGPVIWDRPLLPEKMTRAALDGAKVVLPLIPFAMPGLQSVCFRETGVGIEAPTPLSPILAAGALQSLYQLDGFEPPEWFRENIVSSGKGWEQRGPYLKPLFSRALYPEVYARFLTEGVILAPDPDTPSVLPGEASAGELALLVKLFEEDV